MPTGMDQQTALDQQPTIHGNLVHRRLSQANWACAVTFEAGEDGCRLPNFIGSFGC